jgi:hypothetical protein
MEEFLTRKSNGNRQSKAVYQSSKDLFFIRVYLDFARGAYLQEIPWKCTPPTKIKTPLV